MPRFKKGSLEAKKYMAQIRKKKAVPKKTATKKAVPKKTVKKSHVDTKSHNVNVRVVSGYKGRLIGAFFNDDTINELDKLKKEYYKLAKKYHPDAGGTKEQFQQLQNEYEKQRERILKGGNFTAEQKTNEVNIDNALKDVIDVLVSIPGIDIEIIGKWIWVSGNTFPVYQQLKGAGLEFLKKAGKPFWVYKGVESYGRGKMTMDEIRNKYGSKKINPNERKKLEGIGYIPVKIPLAKKQKLKRALIKLTRAMNKRPI